MQYKSGVLSNSISCHQCLRLFDQLNIGALTIDVERKISGYNLYAQSLLGLGDMEVIGKNCLDIFCGIPCFSKCPFEEKWDADVRDMDLEFVDEGEEKHLITRLATSLYDKDNNIIGCLTILQDHSPFSDLVSRIHYEERSLKMILDNLNIGIFTVNKGGFFTFFNKGAENITGYKKCEVLGKKCTVILGKESGDDLKLLKKVMADGLSRNSKEGNLTTRAGEFIPFQADYMPLSNEHFKITGGLAAFQDLTLARKLDQVISDHYTFHHMIGKDPVMQRIFEMVRVVAASCATILIEGATGTGKDLLAKVIHSESDRGNKPFVKVNCAAIPENLLESELFGYVKGAFTGATRDKPGRFSEAHGGTIFLDEIGDLPLSLQAKLLRVLEDKEFYPLGGRHTSKVDVRIVSATNRDLETLVKERLFRQDLFYRLNVLRIDLPPLKERRSDIPLLIRHISRHLKNAGDKRPKDICEKAMDILLNYDYPGNIRELENILEHALIICQDRTIRQEHLPRYILNLHKPAAAQPYYDDEKNDERQLIVELLQKFDRHRGKTAAALRVDRSTLWRKIKKYGIDS